MNITLSGVQGAGYASLQETTKNLSANTLEKAEATAAPAKKRDTFTKSPESLVAKDPSDDVFEFEDSLDFKIRAGMTKEQLATHFGDLAKQLDKDYADGKYSEDEYNELNAQLYETYGSAITWCERRAASYEVIKENMRAKHSEAAEETITVRRNKTNIEKILEGMGIYSKDSGGLTEEEAETLHRLLNAMKKAAEENKQEETGSDEEETDNSEEKSFEERIKEAGERLSRQEDEFANKYCRTDRKEMLNMLDTVRKGGELAGGRDNSYGTLKSETWFTDGYVPKPYY